MNTNKHVHQRKEPVREHSRLMVEDIIEAANIVLLEEGLSNFNTNRVAKVAGVSIGSLYQYFPNKEALLLRLQEQEVQTTWNEIYSILKDISRSPRERLEEVPKLSFCLRQERSRHKHKHSLLLPVLLPDDDDQKGTKPSSLDSIVRNDLHLKPLAILVYDR